MWPTPTPDTNAERRLERAIDNAPILLALIGPHWRGDRSQGSPRIFDDEDFVRAELNSAFNYGPVSVVVLLLVGGRLPAADELPESIRALASAPTLTLDPDDFDRAVDVVVEVLLKTRMKRTRITGPSPRFEESEEIPFTRGSEPGRIG